MIKIVELFGPGTLCHELWAVDAEKEARVSGYACHRQISMKRAE